MIVFLLMAFTITLIHIRNHRIATTRNIGHSVTLAEYEATVENVDKSGDIKVQFDELRELEIFFRVTGLN